jgi:aminoglycoside phosphotransferase (APT) family kinase protein
VARSPLVLAALANAAVPGLAPVSTRNTTEPGAVFDTAVVVDERDRRWVVRAPSKGAAGPLMEAELSLLAQLRDEKRGLPFAVPDPRATVELPEGGRAVVYPYLPGHPLHPGDLQPGPGLSASLGQALAAVHELPPAIGIDAGLPAYSADEYRARRLVELDQAAGSGKVSATLLGRWEKSLEDVGRWRFSLTLVHGDLVAEHVLVDGDAVCGILNWGDAKVADPADDLAWLAIGADEPALESVLEAYSMARSVHPDPHLGARARLAGELALARWLLHGVHTDDPAIIDDAVGMLADLEAEVGDSEL